MLYIRLYIPPSEALCSLLFELLLLLLLLPLLPLLLPDFLPLPLEEDARRGVVVVVGLVLPSLSLSCCGAKLFCCSCCSDNTFSFLLCERSSSVVLNKTFGNANRMRLNKNKPSVIKVSLDSPPSNVAFRRPRSWCWCCFGEKSLPLIVVISFSLRRRVSMLVVCVLIQDETVLKLRLLLKECDETALHIP